MKKFLRWWQRRNGHKYINGGNGVISLFLVAIMVPFVTLADFLVESARYHSAVTVLDEAMDSASLSVMADYDQYLYDRFGLLAVDNNKNIFRDYSFFLEQNTESLHAWGLNDISAQGKYALTDEKILQKQIAEFSQYSAPAALVNDLGLADLITTLEKMTKLTDIFKIVTGVGDTTDALLSMAHSLKDLKDVAGSFETAKADYDAKFNAFETAYNHLAATIGEYNQKKYKVNEIEKRINEFDEISVINSKIAGIQNELEELEEKKNNNEITLEEYENIKNTKNEELDVLNKDLETALAKHEDLKRELQAAQEELKVTENNLSEAKKSFTIAKTEYSTSIETVIKCLDTYQENGDQVMEDVESLLTSAVDLGFQIEETNASNKQKQEELKEEKKKLEKKYNSTEDIQLKEQYQESIQKMEEQIQDFEASGKSIAGSGEAAKGEVSSYAKDIQESMKGYKKEKLGQYVKDLIEIKRRLKELNSSSLTANSTLDKSLYYIALQDGFLTSNSIQILMDTLKEKIMGGSVQELLDAFGSGLRALFKTNLFYDTRLTSFLEEDTGIGTSDMELMIQDFSKLIDLLDGTASVVPLVTLVNVAFHLNEIVQTVISLTKHFVDFLSGIATRAIVAVSEILSEQCGDKILVDEYLLKTCSNRLDIEDDGEMGGKNPFTGYSFANVKFAKHDNQLPIIGGIESLKQLFEESKNGGTDIMFSGAEAEYILTGGRSEACNQATVFFQIYLVRLILDSGKVFTDAEVNTIAAAATICSFVVKLLYFFTEPLIDTILIVNDSSVPLLKKVVYLTPSGISSLVKQVVNLGLSTEDQNKLVNDAGRICKVNPAAVKEIGDDGKGIKWKYENYLFVLMLLSLDNKTAMERFDNLVCLEAKAHYGQENFSMDRAYTCIEGSVKGKFDPVLPLGGLAVNGIFEQKRSRMRGY